MGREGKRTVISKRALVQRINRKLILDDQQIRAVPGGNLELGVGKYFLVDVRKNLITRTHVDLNELGREIGVLQPSEVCGE
jgi:hypothetical protein